MGGPAYIDGDEEKSFDNFYVCRFSYGGYEWTSTEHAYQAMKFIDKEHIERIRSETDVAVVYFLGQVEYVTHTDEWIKDHENEKIRLMYEINKAKFSQNDVLKKILLFRVGEIEFRGNRFWGKKGKRGLNWGGRILTRIREELLSIQEV
ncbi:MAG: NADAR family protein [Candidatus Colwellbacteria bacterium]|nr:NADAR family protein [Candidatus Colwellbacteria bacterium]